MAEANLQPSSGRTLDASLGRKLLDHIQRCQTQPDGNVPGSMDVPYKSQATISSNHRDHDADITNDWYQEWSTASKDPLPSNIRPMNILSEPAWGHRNAPQHRPKEVWLDHYEPDMVPEGRALQDLRAMHEEKRYLEEDAESVVRQAERTIDRLEVMEAARRSKVVDLTGDLTDKSRDFWSICTDGTQSERYKHTSWTSSHDSGMYHRSFHKDPSSRQNPPKQYSNDLNLPPPALTRAPYGSRPDDIEHPYLRYPQYTVTPGRRPLYDYN
jgi:hypothetical protein